LIRCCRGMIALRHSGSIALLGSELKRWLEEIHEQARGSVHTAQYLNRGHAPQPLIADQPSHHGAVFLLDPRLIVLLIGSQRR
jgi:hypothetical protein